MQRLWVVLMLNVKLLAAPNYLDTWHTTCHHRIQNSSLSVILFYLRGIIVINSNASSLVYVAHE